MIKAAQELSKVAWDDVQVRGLRETDIDLIVDYYYQKTNKTPSMGLDVSKLPAEELFRERYLQIAKEQSPKSGLLVVEYQGRPVGIHPLRPIRETDADFHAHFWDAEVRGKGMIAISGYKACAYFFEQFGFERILITAPKNNALAMAAAMKLPLRAIGEKQISGPLFAEMPAVVFELTRADFDSFK